MGLSNKDMNSLFQDVIFHPSFSLDEVNVGSITDSERYEQQLFKKEDGWDEYVYFSFLPFYHFLSNLA
jgi:hypothetical protein